MMEEMGPKSHSAEPRSKSDRVDVSSIAALFGGGGHKGSRRARIQPPDGSASLADGHPSGARRKTDAGTEMTPAHTPFDGALLVDKPSGVDLARCRGQGETTSTRVGTAEPLDPMATGPHPVLGKADPMSERFTVRG